MFVTIDNYYCFYSVSRLFPVQRSFLSTRCVYSKHDHVINLHVD